MIPEGEVSLYMNEAIKGSEDAPKKEIELFAALEAQGKIDANAQVTKKPLIAQIVAEKEIVNAAKEDAKDIIDYVPTKDEVQQAVKHLTGGDNPDQQRRLNNFLLLIIAGFLFMIICLK